MITENRKCKLIFRILSVLCVVAIVTCLICDLAVNKGVSWSLYVTSSVLFAWLVVSPPLMTKRLRVVVALAAFTVFLPIFLYALNCFTPVRGWYNPLGLPIALVVLAAVWVTWLLFRFLKINRWFLAAMVAFLFGILVNASVNMLVNLYVGNRPFGIINIIDMLGNLIIVALLCFIGHGRTQK